MNFPVALPLQQHPTFQRALRHLGRDVVSVAVDGAYPVIAVRLCGQLIASRGPLWQTSRNQGARTSALARSGLRLLNAETADDAGLHRAGFRKLATAASVAELDLSGSAADRLSAAQGKWRNRWRRAWDAPVTIRYERFSLTAHDWLLQADRAQQRQKRFRSLPHRFISGFAASDPDGAQVHVACHAGEPVAAMLFLLHDPVVTYHLGWIDRHARQWGLHHRLLYDAADTFAGRGYTRLDMGSVDTDNAPGLARFKIGSGAQIRALGGSWLRIGRTRG